MSSDNRQLILHGHIKGECKMMRPHSPLQEAFTTRDGLEHSLPICIIGIAVNTVIYMHVMDAEM